MKIQLLENNLKYIKNKSSYSYNMYELPFNIESNDILLEEYYESSNEYCYSVGYLDDGLYFAMMYFFPSVNRLEIEIDNWSKEMIWS